MSIPKKLLGIEEDTLEKRLSNTDMENLFPLGANVPMLEEAQEDAEIAQINEEANSPFQKDKEELIEDKVEKELKKTPLGQLNNTNKDNNKDDNKDKAPKTLKQRILSKLDERDKLYENNKIDLEEARQADYRRNLLANSIKALGTIGAADIQRSAGVDANIEKFTPIKLDDSEVSDVKDNRNLLLKKLKDDLKTLQGKEPSKLDQLKLAIEQRKLDLNEKKLGRTSTEKSEPTFEEKEQIKLDMKMKHEKEKEMSKIRQANLKDKKKAEQSAKKLDEQLQKVKRAKELLKGTVKGTSLFDTGPLDQYTASFGGKRQELRQAFNDLALEKMSKLFEGMSKAVDSDAERKMFEQSQASMGNNPEVNMKILNMMEKELQRIQSKEKNFAKRFDKKGNEIQKIEIELPDGTKGRIDANKVDDFLKEYPNAKIKE